MRFVLLGPAGRREGNAGPALVRPLRHPADLHGRHPARARADRDGAWASRRVRSWTAGNTSRTIWWSRWSWIASPSPMRRRASSSMGSPAPCPGTGAGGRAGRGEPAAVRGVKFTISDDMAVRRIRPLHLSDVQAHVQHGVQAAGERHPLRSRRLGARKPGRRRRAHGQAPPGRLPGADRATRALLRRPRPPARGRRAGDRGHGRRADEQALGWDGRDHPQVARGAGADASRGPHRGGHDRRRCWGRRARASTMDLDAVAERYSTSTVRRPPSRATRGPSRPDLRLDRRRDRARHPLGDAHAREGEVLSLDFGAIWEGYHADSAVTVFVGGGAPSRKRSRLSRRPRTRWWPGSSRAAREEALRHRPCHRDRRRADRLRHGSRVRRSRHRQDDARRPVHPELGQAGSRPRAAARTRGGGRAHADPRRSKRPACSPTAGPW